LNILEDSEAAREIYNLWSEYETGISTEAIIVKDMDRLEMIIQASEYEKRDGKDLSSFFDNTQGLFIHPMSCSIAEAIYKERLSGFTKT
jgi:putative hydrolase of HD superfamily